jgi:hypothetical protein
MAGPAGQGSLAIAVSQAEARVVSLRSRLPEQRARHHDQRGLAREQLRRAETQLVHRAGREVLRHHVGPVGKSQRQFHTRRLAQVDRDAPLVGIEQREHRRRVEIDRLTDRAEEQEIGRTDDRGSRWRLLANNVTCRGAHPRMQPRVTPDSPIRGCLATSWRSPALESERGRPRRCVRRCAARDV